MKRLIAILTMIGGFAMIQPAQAETVLGHSDCNATQCATESRIIRRGERKISDELNCDPNQGACTSVMNKEYGWHLTKWGGGQAVSHYRVRATAANDPDTGHFLLFYNQSVVQHLQCSIHPGWKDN